MNTMHRNPQHTSLILGAMLAAAALFAPLSEARVFTSSKDGRTLEGTIVGATDASVRLDLGTRQVEVPLDALIEADRRYIELWKTEEKKSKVPDLEIRINTGLNRRRDPAFFSYEYYDASFDFEILVENDERDFDVEGAKGFLVVIGENCERNFSDFVVMQKATMPITVKAKEKFEWKGPEVQYRYAEGRSYEYGYKYHSYIFQIKNSTDKVIYEKVMAPRFNGHAEAILKFDESDKFDKDAKPVKKARS